VRGAVDEAFFIHMRHRASAIALPVALERSHCLPRPLSAFGAEFLREHFRKDRVERPQRYKGGLRARLRGSILRRQSYALSNKPHGTARESPQLFASLSYFRLKQVMLGFRLCERHEREAMLAPHR